GTEDKYNIQVNVDESLLNDDGELSAPIKKGTKIGTVELTMEDGEDFGYIFDNDDEQGAAEIVASEDVDKKNWFSLMLGAIGQIFTNLYDKFIGLFYSTRSIELINFKLGGVIMDVVNAEQVRVAE